MRSEVNMNEFFLRNQKIILFTGIIIVIGILVLIAWLTRSTTNTTQTQDVNSLPYEFINDQKISEEQKYLMLQAKILVEDYGTYSNNDLRGLYDLKNQSTQTFVSQIDALINSTKKVDIFTTVDPDSISIDKNNSNLFTLRATVTDNLTKTTTQKQYSIQFTKEGEYWLVSYIIEK